MAIGGTGIVGAIGQVLAALELAEQAAAAGFGPTAWSCRPRPVARRRDSWSDSRTAGLTTTVHGVAVTPPEPLRLGIAAIVAGLGGDRGLAEVGDADIVLDGSQLGDG